MELRQFGQTNMRVTPIGLGTWVMGGWMWGGADEQDAIDAVKISVDGGVNLIDTAPIYGFGKAEEIVGKALKKNGGREKIILATKFGLEWDEKERIRRNTSRKRLLQEIDDSLRRLQTDYIDIYQVHWPDNNTPAEETMETLMELYEKGVIKAVGVSNYSVAQIEESMRFAPVHSLQPPFNMFEQEIKADILPFCVKNNIATLTYGTLCRGLLTGKFSKDSSFKKGDLRKYDPKFKGEQFAVYLNAVEKLKRIATQKNAATAQLAIEWTIEQPGVTCALIGARNPKQAQENIRILNGRVFSSEELKHAGKIIDETVAKPVGPEFMAPPKE
ncbi:MAG: aldo/keto reductase [Candidatus Auribacterota bacterium]|jgi:aryl-alcohol dehydrogenase-like predicted oxidoreductase|nr:aldo/keto reductase [Candidatus Auribacterota bacterium]